MVTLDECKAHLNVDYDEDDKMIGDMLEVAKEIVADDIGLTTSIEEAYPDELPRKLHHAIKIQVANLYFNRESTSTNAQNFVPYGYAHLIQGFKKY